MKENKDIFKRFCQRGSPWVGEWMSSHHRLQTSEIRPNCSPLSMNWKIRISSSIGRESSLHSSVIGGKGLDVVSSIWGFDRPSLPRNANAHPAQQSRGGETSAEDAFAVLEERSLYKILARAELLVLVLGNGRDTLSDLFRKKAR